MNGLCAVTLAPSQTSGLVHINNRRGLQLSAVLNTIITKKGVDILPLAMEGGMAQNQDPAFRHFAVEMRPPWILGFRPP